MDSSIFAAAFKTEKLIDRENELKTIRDIIGRRNRQDTHVIIIEGGGGRGKTRLLEEIFKELTGHLHPNHVSDPPASRPTGQHVEPDYARANNVVIAALLDFADIRLTTFGQFILELRGAFICEAYPKVNFSEFDDTRERLSNLDIQAGFKQTQHAIAQTEAAFLSDYQILAQTHQFIWVLDTAEQLDPIRSEFLAVNEQLLTAEDLNFYTGERLLALLKERCLPNTTILLAGRDQEAKFYFDRVKDPKNGAGANYQVTSLPLSNFNVDQTRAYLEVLADSWARSAPNSDVARTLRAVADNPDRVSTLQLYTDGQPVRLALYIDVLTEGYQIPLALRKSYEQAKKDVGWDEANQKIDETLLERIQFEIEAEFIKLIFTEMGELRSQILRILAQARRGLDKYHLHFLLDTPNKVEFDFWPKDKARLQEIQDELDNMRNLSFIKVIPSNRFSLKDEEDEEDDEKILPPRFVLQDEMYRIYDRHMEAALQAEINSRRRIYEQLVRLAEYEFKRLLRQKTEYREEAEASLHWESPGRALNMKFRYDPAEQERRNLLDQRILTVQAERLYYELRLNPEEGLDDTYYDLSEEVWRANKMEADIQLQAEVWRIFGPQDEKSKQEPSYQLARRFIQLQPPDSGVDQETLWQRLKYTVEHENLVRWLKRFVFSQRYCRAIEFAEDVEKVVTQMPQEPGTLGWMLNQPFARSERSCWWQFARIVAGQNASGAIDSLSETAKKLKGLLPPAPSWRGEESAVTRPAEMHLRRVIGVTYGNLGVGYAYQGQYRKAVQAYTEALPYLRDANFKAQAAVTLNDLSRALSEIGRSTRPLRICHDGLGLKKQTLGAESSIAYSYNTLALIYNNNHQAIYAWVEAVRAVAYFKRLADSRGLGLALKQLAEALRRLAFSVYPIIEALDTPEELLNAAKEAASQSLAIFSESEEVMRRIEAEIELGCVYRDYVHYIKSQLEPGPKREQRWISLKNKAVHYLTHAIEQAKKSHYPRHHLDAQVDLAITYYYAEDFEQLEQLFAQIFSDAADRPYLLRREVAPPLPEEIDQTYAFALFSKLWSVKGRVAFDQFNSRVKVIKEESTGNQVRQRVQADPIANQRLQEAAEAFVLALGYAQLFSARSVGIKFSFDQLYNYLKTFNHSELEMFYKYQHEAREAYRVAEIRAENLADVEGFLFQSFGNYFPANR